MEKQTPELRPKTGISHFKACRVQSATFQNVLAYSIGEILWQFISNTSLYLDRCWSRFHDILSYELLLVTLFDRILKIQHPKVTQRCWYPKERGQIVLPEKQYSPGPWPIEVETLIQSWDGISSFQGFLKSPSPPGCNFRWEWVKGRLCGSDKVLLVQTCWRDDD